MDEFEQAVKEEICDMIGHEWWPLGGELLQCARCGTQKWMDWAEDRYGETWDE